MEYLESKGKADYDFKEDILFLYKVIPQKDHEYNKSFDVDGFVIDIDRHNHVIGVEIMNASKKLMIDKKLLHSIKDGKLSAIINKKLINLVLSLKLVYRNTEKTAILNLERLNKQSLKDTNIKFVFAG